MNRRDARQFLDPTSILQPSLFPFTRHKYTESHLSFQMQTHPYISCNSKSALKNSWGNINCWWWLFWPMKSKHCSTNRKNLWPIGRCVWAARGTRLKNKPHLVTFHDSILVNLLTFHPTLLLSRLSFFSLSLSLSLSLSMNLNIHRSELLVFMCQVVVGYAEWQMMPWNLYLNFISFSSIANIWKVI